MTPHFEIPMDSQALMQGLMFKLQRLSNNKQKVLSLAELNPSSYIMHQWFTIQKSIINYQPCKLWLALKFKNLKNE
jgi:hypothetical protein